MNWKIPLIVLLILLFTASAYSVTYDEWGLKATLGGSKIISFTTDASGNLTVTGATTVNWGSATMSYSGTPSWALDNDQYLDDGVTNSPVWGVRDATDQVGYMYKLDAGHVVLYNDTAGDGYAFYTSGDIDDYLIVTTVSNVPTISTAGTASLNISPDSDINFMPDSDTNDYLSVSSSGTQVTAGIVGGADLIITHDTDAKGIAFQMGNDADNYLSTYTTSNVPWLVCNGNGDFNIATDHADGEINIMGGGDTSDYFQFDAASNVPVLRTVGTASMILQATDDTDDYLVYAVTSNVPTLTATGDCDFELATAAANFVDISTGGLRFSDEETLTTASDVMILTADDGIATFSPKGYENFGAVVKMVADQGDDIADTWWLTANESATATFTIGNDNAVKGTEAVLLTLSSVGDLIMAGTTPTLTVGDNGTEDSGFVLNNDTDYYVAFDTTGGIAENLLTIGLGSTIGTTPSMGFDASNHTYIINDDSTANAVEDILTIYKEVNGATHGSNGVGADIVFVIEDAAAAETQATIAVALTDVTDSGEEADIYVTQNSAGALAETLRLVAANSATTGDYMQYTANTTETDAVHDILVFKTATGTAADGYGIGISFKPEDATGSDEVASIDIVQTTAARATNYTDFVFSQNVNGTITETVRFDADAGVIVKEDLVSNTYNYATDAEVSDNYVITLTPAPAAYVTGMMITFKANTANTGACAVNVNALGSKALKMLHDQDPPDSYIESGSIVLAVYDGTNYQMFNADANP